MKRFSPLFALAGLTSTVFAGGTINVEIDYMVAADHDHRPTLEEMVRVVQMFECQGWTLNVVIDDAIPETAVIECDQPVPKGQNFWNCDGNASYKSIKDTWFDNTNGQWHYCVFGHQYDSGSGVGSSGRADSANDFIVTLFNFSGQPNGSPFDVAATFAHELGHNLGLGHASPLTSLLGGGPYSPNYASVMSYQYQLRGVKTRLECLGITDGTSIFKDLDYSHGRLGTLDEASLREWRSAGIRPTDFDCDGVLDLSPVVQELTTDAPWCGTNGALSVVSDYDDWDNIFDVPTGTSDVAYPDPGRDWECITRQEIEALRALDAAGFGPGDPGSGCSDATLSDEGCVPSNSMLWVDPAAFFPGTGKGSSPFLSFTDALDNAPNGAVLYLQEGVQNLDSPGTLLIDQPLTLSSPGGAIIDPQ